MFKRLHLLLAAAAFALLAAACNPQTAAERAYFEQKEAEKQERRDLKSKLTTTTMSDADVISIVTSNAAPDNIGNIDDWLKRQVGSMEGQVLFPRWKVMRQGNTKVEVQYAFSVIDDQNRIIKRGYQWQLDTIMKLVGSTRELTFAGQQPTAVVPTADSKQRRRLAEAEASLE